MPSSPLGSDNASPWNPRNKDHGDHESVKNRSQRRWECIGEINPGSAPAIKWGITIFLSSSNFLERLLCMTVLKNVGDHPGGTNITFCQHFRKTTWSQNNFCLAPPHQICQWACHPQQNVEFVWCVVITL